MSINFSDDFHQGAIKKFISVFLISLEMLRALGSYMYVAKVSLLE